MKSKRLVCMFALILVSSGLALSQTTKTKNGAIRDNVKTTNSTSTAKVVTTDKLSPKAGVTVTEGKSIIASTPDGIKVVLHPNMTWEFWSEPKPVEKLFGPNLKSFPVGEVVETLNKINFSKGEFETGAEHEKRIERDFRALKLNSDSRKLSDLVFVFDRKWDGTSFPDIQASNNYNAENQEFTFSVGWALPKLILDENSNVIKYKDAQIKPNLYYLDIGSLEGGGKFTGAGKCVSDPVASKKLDFRVPMNRRKAKQVADDIRLAVFATPKCYQKLSTDITAPNATKLYLSVDRFVVFNRKTGEVYFDYPGKRQIVAGR